MLEFTVLTMNNQVVTTKGGHVLKLLNLRRFHLIGFCHSQRLDQRSTAPILISVSHFCQYILELVSYVVILWSHWRQ